MLDRADPVDQRAPGLTLQAPPQLAAGGSAKPAWTAWRPSCQWNTRHIPGLAGLSLLGDGVDEMRRNAREAFRRGATLGCAPRSSAPIRDMVILNGGQRIRCFA